MQIRDSVFIVTGAASGLGAATATLLAEQGGKVIIADLNDAAGKALAAQLGAHVHYMHTDVTDEISAQAAIDTALQQFGTLHGLVNCAGIAPAEKLVGKNGPHRLDSFIHTLNVNLVGTFNMCRLAADAMSRTIMRPDAEGERGVLINTASVAAFEGQIAQAAYAASKGGVVSMTLPLARELARYGIRCVAIAPGIFETPMLQAMPQDVQDALARTVPFPPRAGRTREYAQMVRSIIENPMLNGTTLRLDGALRMAAK